MVKITQVFLNDESNFKRQENFAHANAIEFLPSARDVSYLELAEDEYCSLLVFQIIADTANEEEMLEKNEYRKFMAQIRRALMNLENGRILSISYCEQLNKTKDDGLGCRVLINMENQEPLSEDAILDLEQILTKEVNENRISALEKTANSNESASEPQIEDITEQTINNSVNTEQVQEEPVEVFQEIENTQGEEILSELNENKEEKQVALEKSTLGNHYERDFFNDEQNLTATKETIFSDDFWNFEDNKDNVEKIEEMQDIPNFIKESENNASISEQDKNIDAPLNTMSGNKEDVNTIVSMETNIVKNPVKDNKNIEQDPDVEYKEDVFINEEKAKEPVTSIITEDSKEVIKSAEEQIENNTNEEDIPILNRSQPYKPSVDVSFDFEEDPIYKIHEDDYNAVTTSSKEKLKRAYEQIVNYFLTNEKNYTKRAVLGEIEEKDFLDNVKAYISKYLKIPIEDIPYIINKIEKTFFSYHKLIPAINNPDVSDIRVTKYNQIILKIKGKHYVASDLSFINNMDYEYFIRNLIIRNKLSLAYPIIVHTDNTFCKDYILRFNICLPAVNTSGEPTLHIRKEPKNKTTLLDLINKEMLDENIARYLLEKVKTSRGLVFSGPSASGKTTLMNALVDYIPKSESILAIQESDELFTNIHPNAYFQHIVRNVRGEIVIGLSELGQNGLLCDSQYFLIGEIKGSEARDMLRASNTGHKCWCSLHSKDAKETIPRLADYVKLDADYTLAEAERMLKDLEVIVYIEGYKVKEITEIVGYDEENKKIIYRNIYKRAAM